MAKYKRVVLKLSGEALANKEEKLILNADKLKSVARSIAALTEGGVQVGVVIGAGNIWRGKLADAIGIERGTADYMGMLGTIINCLALQSTLEEIGLQARVLSAIEVEAVCEPYIKRRAIRHLEKGRVVIFAGGTGNPFFTTDSCAALRALDIEAEAILMAKNGVEGVYTGDPRTDRDAKFISHLTYAEMTKKQLKVMDQTAVSLLASSSIDTIVFNMADESNFVKAVNGEKVGTIISKGDINNG
ncbi:MAG TPA: UMP kinase [Bacilli bacterium]|nr:UMP kinase [Bacilli bacterium]